MHTIHAYAYMCMKPLLKIATILTMLLYLQLYPDINVLTQE